MSDAWTIARDNFTDDDGSLPGVVFSNLAPHSVSALFAYFRHRGAIATANPTVYDNFIASDVPLNHFDDPAERVVSGMAAPFYCCFSGVSNGGVVIPPIGLFVFQDLIEFDYHMGSEWNRENVNAFFRVLGDLKALAPEAIIDSAGNEGVPYPAEFEEALKR